MGSVTSLSTMIRKMSKALNDPGDPWYDEIPDSRDAVAQYLELYSMSGDPEDLEQFVDFDYTKTLMTIQYKAENISDIDEILDKLDILMGENSFPHVIGGYSLADKEINDSVYVGQNRSLFFALITIMILVALIFKNYRAGLLGGLPLLFAVLCTFGIMGWLGLELNIVTALLSSISIGLGVDFTIQVFWRIKWELANGLDYADSIKATLRTIGRGIVVNACAEMLGFSSPNASSIRLSLWIDSIVSGRYDSRSGFIRVLVSGIMHNPTINTVKPIINQRYRLIKSPFFILMLFLRYYPLFSNI